MWREHIFSYCERGVDPSFWAEPLNALSNAGFLVAGALLWRRIAGLRQNERDVDYMILAGLVLAIGAGSFVFHTFAQRWAVFADVLPIAFFIFIYFNFALARFLEVPPGLALVLTAGLGGLFALARAVASFGSPAVDGSIGYLPALLVLLAVAWMVAQRGHPAGPRLLLAGGIFAVSLTARVADAAACGLTNVSGYALGTHFIWHILNAVTLYLLCDAAIAFARHTQKRYEVLPPTQSGSAT